MRDSRADEKGYPSSDESPCRSCKRERARAALGPILFGQPQRVHREVRAAYSEEEQADHEPEKRWLAQIKHVAEPEGDEYCHQREVNPKRRSAPEFLGQHRQRETTGDRKS